MPREAWRVPTIDFCQERLTMFLVKKTLQKKYGLISNDDCGSRPDSTSTCSRFAIERFAKSNDLFRRRYKMLSAMYLY